MSSSPLHLRRAGSCHDIWTRIANRLTSNCIYHDELWNAWDLAMWQYQFQEPSGAISWVFSENLGNCPLCWYMLVYISGTLPRVPNFALWFLNWIPSQSTTSSSLPLKRWRAQKGKDPSSNPNNYQGRSVSFRDQWMFPNLNLRDIFSLGNWDWGPNFIGEDGCTGFALDTSPNGHPSEYLCVMLGR